MNDMTQHPIDEHQPQTLVIPAPSPTRTREGMDMLELAQSYVGAVTFPEMREAIGSDLQRNKAALESLENERLKIAAPLHKAWTATNQLFAKLALPFQQAESMMKKEAIRYDSEVERRQRAAEAEAARKADDERKRLAAEAAKQQAAGNVETAHAIQQAAQMVAPVPVAHVETRVAGEAKRTVWSAEVSDLGMLCLGVGAGYMLRTYDMNLEQQMTAINTVQRETAPGSDLHRNLSAAIATLRILADVPHVSTDNVLPNMPVLNGQAKALKENLRVPGVRAVSTKVLATRAAKEEA